MEHDKDLSWEGSHDHMELSSSEAGFTRQVEMGDDGDGLPVKGVTVQGSCPRCRGLYVRHFRYTYAPGSGPGLLSFLRKRKVEDCVRKLIEGMADEIYFCECGVPHPNWPQQYDPSHIGCGSSWTIRWDD